MLTHIAKIAYYFSRVFYAPATEETRLAGRLGQKPWFQIYVRLRFLCFLIPQPKILRLISLLTSKVQVCTKRNNITENFYKYMQLFIL